jgi:hypothetical protein
MTDIATKGGAVIFKDGAAAENCDCCGGWYCYDSVCDCPSISSISVTMTGDDDEVVYTDGDGQRARGSLLSGTHSLQKIYTANGNDIIWDSPATRPAREELWIGTPYTLTDISTGAVSLGVYDTTKLGANYDYYAGRGEVTSAISALGKTPGILVKLAYTNSGTLYEGGIRVLAYVPMLSSFRESLNFGDRYGTVITNSPTGTRISSRFGYVESIQLTKPCDRPYGLPRTGIVRHRIRNSIGRPFSTITVTAIDVTA